MTATLFEAMGGEPAAAGVIDAFMDRLAHDTTVKHHFADDRIEGLKAGQRAWLAVALGAEPSDASAQLAAAHHGLVITDDQIAVVIGHLDAALDGAGVEAGLRTRIVAVISRLWFARVF